MIKYKLTNQNLQTYNGFQWGIGKKVTTSGKGELCSEGWLHFYHSPELAVILNPIHANFKNPRLFEVEVGETCLDDRGLKGGATEMTLIKELDLPQISLTQKIAFGILCAKEVCDDIKWNEWADKWLSGEDRTMQFAYNALAEAPYVAYKAAYAAYIAADAAYSAAYTASSATDAFKQLNLQQIVIKALKYV
jgi:hypothetical protein